MARTRCFACLRLCQRKTELITAAAEITGQLVNSLVPSSSITAQREKRRRTEEKQKARRDADSDHAADTAHIRDFVDGRRGDDDGDRHRNDNGRVSKGEEQADGDGRLAGRDERAGDFCARRRVSHLSPG